MLRAKSFGLNLLVLILFFHYNLLAFSGEHNLQENIPKIEYDKENGSIDNVLREYGPITICADRATYSSDENKLMYYGNVIVMQIHNKYIACNKSNLSKDVRLYFDREDNSESFENLQAKWFKEAATICSEEKACNFISGEKLVMQLTANDKIKTLTMESDGSNKTQFYTFPINSVSNYKKSKKIIRGPATGFAQKIIYNVVNKKLELYQNAEVIQNDNKYKGDNIIYYITHDLVSIPGSKNKRSKIILEGVSGDLKIDTGLSPINEYNEKK